MGVMGCFRNGCDNIMCDTYVTDVGYICTDCQREFKNHMVGKGKNVATEKEIREELLKFMETRANNLPVMKMDIDTFFQNSK